MPTKSASKTITRDPRWLGPAIPPGEPARRVPQAPGHRSGRCRAAARRLAEPSEGNRARQARHDGRHGLAARPVVEDFAPVLDATAGRLGSASCHRTRGAEGLLTGSIIRPTQFSRGPHHRHTARPLRSHRPDQCGRHERPRPCRRRACGAWASLAEARWVRGRAEAGG